MSEPRRRLPGDLTPEQLIERVIRVDQAGEYGARRIYEGQLAVLKHGPDRSAVEHMAEQEGRHLADFDRLLGDRRVRPDGAAAHLACRRASRWVPPPPSSAPRPPWPAPSRSRK